MGAVLLGAGGAFAGFVAGWVGTAAVLGLWLGLRRARRAPPAEG